MASHRIAPHRLTARLDSAFELYCTHRVPASASLQRNSTYCISLARPPARPSARPRALCPRASLRPLTPLHSSHSLIQTTTVLLYTSLTHILHVFLKLSARDSLQMYEPSIQFILLILSLTHSLIRSVLFALKIAAASLVI